MERCIQFFHGNEVICPYAHCLASSLNSHLMFFRQVNSEYEARLTNATRNTFQALQWKMYYGVSCSILYRFLTRALSILLSLWRAIGGKTRNIQSAPQLLKLQLWCPTSWAIARQDALGNLASSAYDAPGRVVAAVDPLNGR